MMTLTASNPAIRAEEAIVFPCLQVRQPIGTFYVGTINAQDLVLISYADMRAIKEGEARDVEEFSGIQRPLSQQRVGELKQYVGTVDASFPTSIILHIPSEHAEYATNGTMRVKRDRRIAKIIDGQHRIAGLEGYNGPPFELNVTIFVDMDPEDQALLFATINLKQTKVNKSLAYDLYDFAQTRSPQKTCHNIARLLNSRAGSPLFHKIKILGSAIEGRNETITQAAFIDRLIVYLSDNPMRDRDALKRSQELPIVEGAKTKKMIFRQLFRGGHDAEIAKVIWNYFDAVAIRWPDAWEEKTRGKILNRTTGFSALMRFLGDTYPNQAQGHPVPEVAAFLAIFSRVALSDEDFTPARYLPGSGGEAELYRDLISQSGITPT
jgi:DGQHR domain-containing protein